MRTEIESMQHSLQKEATTSTSIDTNKATSIDVTPQTSQIHAEPEILVEKKDEWEITYINTRINDVYNVDWVCTRIDLLQQDLDIIRKNDPQPATSIDVTVQISIDVAGCGSFLSAPSHRLTASSQPWKIGYNLMRICATVSPHLSCDTWTPCLHR